jgi:hypothetical protein
MPNVDRWARLTVRLPAATYRRLEALAAEIPGLTPNALLRSTVEQALPQLELLAAALRAARAGQGGNALELLAALTRAVGAPPAVPEDEPTAPTPADVNAALAHVRALQAAQAQRLQDVLDEPQGRGARQALARLQALHGEQAQRVEQAVAATGEDMPALLEWARALQAEQARWLQEILDQPHAEPLQQALAVLAVVQAEQTRSVQRLSNLLLAPVQADQPVTAAQEQNAAAFHQRWLASTGGTTQRPPSST